MKTKLFEIRDRMTFIPVLALRLAGSNESEKYLLRRTGFGANQILINRLDGNHRTSNTIYEAYKYIEKHFDKLIEGQVIDLEFIRGETDKPKESERLENVCFSKMRGV